MARQWPCCTSSTRTERSVRRKHSLTCARILLLFVKCVLILNAQESKLLFASSPGHVLAMGKWRTSSAKDDLAKHNVVIHCILEIKMCFETKAEIVDGVPQASLQEGWVMEWNKDGIVAEDNSPICTTARLLINFEEQSVTAIDTP